MTGSKPRSRTGRQSIWFGLLLIIVGATSLCYADLSRADQNDPTLTPLFEQLQLAATNAQAQQIEAQIWQAWIDAPDDHAQALMSQVSNALSIGAYDKALRLSNQLVDSTPQFAEAWNKRATVQYLLGNHAESVADIKQTLLLEPRHFGALSGLGLIFMASGHYEAALDTFNAVLAISPGSDNARGGVAQVESMIGEQI